MNRGLSKPVDPLLEDIRHAVKIGYFDRMKADGPSKIELMTVEELLDKVSLMSPERRRLYLGQISNCWGESAGLSGGKRSKTTRLWLSKGPKAGKGDAA